MTALEFCRDFGARKESLGYIAWRCLRDSVFSRFGIQCRLLTDRQTDRHSTTAYTALA